MAFKRVAGFARIYKEAIRYCDQPLDQKEVNYFLTHFAGGLFEAMARACYAGRLSAEETLLSPDLTRRFYSRLYPAAVKVESFLGPGSIYGISVPDNLVLKKDKDAFRITKICEYTFSTIKGRIGTKYWAYQQDREKFDGVFASADIVFVVPQDSPFLRNDRKSRFDCRTRFESVGPITYSQFWNFVKSICRFYYVENPDLTLVQTWPELDIRIDALR